MSGKPASLPEWERLLSSAARLQQILPDAVLVGGTAAAIHTEHRFSLDADHVRTDLRTRFDEVLRQLESVAGWRTARVTRPVQILGSLDGIQTGVRQLIRIAAPAAAAGGGRNRRLAWSRRATMNGIAARSQDLARVGCDSLVGSERGSRGSRVTMAVRFGAVGSRGSRRRGGCRAAGVREGARRRPLRPGRRDEDPEPSAWFVRITWNIAYGVMRRPLS